MLNKDRHPCLYLHQSWASPQVSPQARNCGLTKKVADRRIYGLWQFKLRTCGCRLFLIFSPQFRKFYTNIEIFFYFRKIFMFFQCWEDSSPSSDSSQTRGHFIRTRTCTRTRALETRTQTRTRTRDFC